MATNEWYYSKKDEKHGPISSADLKQLASKGTLLSSDLVWKQGWPEWKPASSLKGLFGSEQSATPPPLAAAPSTAKGKTLTQKVGEAAKTTALRTTKQAERTKIHSVSLPSAYAALGKQTLADGTLRSELPELFDQADKLSSAIERLGSAISNRPVGESVPDKAKSMAMTAKDKAEIQTRRLQYSKLAAKVGQQVYSEFPERANSGHIAVVEKHLSRVRELDSELETLAGSNSPTEVASDVSRSLFVIATLVTCCFPIGLLLVWRNPNWSSKTKWTWTGATMAVLLGMAVIGSINEAKRLEQLEVANSQWNDGDRESAISTYRELTKYGPSRIPNEQRSKIYGRLIEFDLENARDQSARKLAETAVNYGIEPTLANTEAQGLVREIRESQREKNRESEIAAVTEGEGLMDADNSYDRAVSEHGTVYSASKLFLDFEGNEVAANQKYKGKTIVIDGVVHDIEAGGFMSGVTVNLRKHFDARGVRCQLTGAEGKSETLQNLKAGSLVQIRGYCEGFTGVTVRIKNCKIMK